MKLDGSISQILLATQAPGSHGFYDLKKRLEFFVLLRKFGINVFYT